MTEHTEHAAPEKKAEKKQPQMDSEIKVISAVLRALKPLDIETRLRVARYVLERAADDVAVMANDGPTAN